MQVPRVGVDSGREGATRSVAASGEAGRDTEDCGRQCRDGAAARDVPVVAGAGQKTPQAPVTWEALRLSGQDALAVRASKKLRSDELLLTSFASTLLRMEMDRVPLWRGDHVAIKQLVEDFARYLYLPRLKDSINMKMSTINKKISWPLLAALFGAAVGALSGQFVWALITALGLWALAYVAQNLSAFLKRINARDRTTLPEADGAMSSSLENGSDWLQKWNEDMDYCPTYKGTPREHLERPEVD